MRLAIITHKLCWPSGTSPTGYATDGGFPFQMKALSELFEATTLLVPCASAGDANGEMPLSGHNLTVRPLTSPGGSGLVRKFGMFTWVVRNAPTLLRAVWRADAVHAPIPGDVGTVGLLLALMLRKPLFVRHCGNWLKPVTPAECFWKWIMERCAGGRNIMLATGGSSEPPSRQNPAVRWIFSTTLSERDLESCRSPRAGGSQRSARLIIVCRQEKEKGTGVVVRALPSILEAFPEAILDVCGDGGALNEFKALARSLGLEDRVLFHGKVTHSRVVELMRGADLFCFPTVSSEGFPKVVLEALACGLPVVTTHVSVLPNLIGTGCGVLLDDVTPEATSTAILECLGDDTRYQEMSQQAIMTAAQYSLEQWRDTIGHMMRQAWKDPTVGCLSSQS